MEEQEESLTISSLDGLMDWTKVKQAALVIRAINHTLRQCILKLILETKENLTVTEIYSVLGIEQSVVSQHLAKLRKAGFVTARRDGRFIYYSINHTRVDQMNDLIPKIIE